MQSQEIVSLHDLSYAIWFIIGESKNLNLFLYDLNWILKILALVALWPLPKNVARSFTTNDRWRVVTMWRDMENLRNHRYPKLLGSREVLIYYAVLKRFLIECRKTKTKPKVFAWLPSTLNWKPLYMEKISSKNYSVSSTLSWFLVFPWRLRAVSKRFQRGLISPFSSLLISRLLGFTARAAHFTNCYKRLSHSHTNFSFYAVCFQDFSRFVIWEGL